MGTPSSSFPADQGTSEPVPLLQAIDNCLQQRPDLPIILDRQAFTLAELDAAARKLAGAFARTVDPGERIAVMARNGQMALLTWWAAARCGAYLVPLNTSNRGAVLAHQLSDSDPVMVVAEREFAEVLAEPIQAIGHPVQLVLQEAADQETAPGWEQAVAFNDLLDSGDPNVELPDIDPYSISHLVYTAGTTGPSKACMVSHSYLANMGYQMRQNLERTPLDRLWTAMPLFHLAAIGHTIGSLQLGSPISIARQFSVSRFWEDVLEADASMAALMGSMLVMIARAPDNEHSRRAFGQLRVVSGSPVTEELSLQWIERFGLQRVGSGAYGMTEANLITNTPPGEYRAGSAGKLNDAFEVQIVDDRDNPVPVGEVGEIVCRPSRPSIMFDGYWRQPEKTLEVFRGLWFHCGDFGRLDADGYLYFVDRGKDYLRRGGENISSFEIESVIAEHPEVAEVAVHAVRSPLNEDEVKVTVVPVAGADPDPEQLFAWIQPRVPRYAAPSHIEFRAELPKNAVGRVLKRDLREEGITARTWSCDPRTYERRPAPAVGATGQGEEPR